MVAFWAILLVWLRAKFSTELIQSKRNLSCLRFFPKNQRMRMRGGAIEVDAREALEILSENSRWRIIKILIKEALCGKALAARLDLSRSAVSQHLRELRRAGLIQERKDGYFTFCCVQRERLDEVVKLVIALSDHEADPCNVQREKMADKKVKRKNYLPMCNSCVGTVKACANVGGSKPP